MELVKRRRRKTRRASAPESSLLTGLGRAKRTSHGHWFTNTKCGSSRVDGDCQWTYKETWLVGERVSSRSESKTYTDSLLPSRSCFWETISGQLIIVLTYSSSYPIITWGTMSLWSILLYPRTETMPPKTWKLLRIIHPGMFFSTIHTMNVMSWILLLLLVLAYFTLLCLKV